MQKKNMGKAAVTRGKTTECERKGINIFKPSQSPRKEIITFHILIENSMQFITKRLQNKNCNK